MKHEKSFGVIPLRKEKGQWMLLLINHKQGSFWAFPKGHGEPGETPEQTAKRELFEETGQKILQMLSEKTLSETYHFYRGSQLIEKTVIYFIAEVEGELRLQEGEVNEARWVKLNEAEQWITFKESRNLLQETLKLLS